MKDFYMTLFSNSSMDYYPGNKTSTFTVQLPRNIILHGEWEVALSEIQYPYSFFTVQDGQNEIKLQSFTATRKFIDKKSKITPPLVWSSVKITPGFYVDAKDIVTAVNNAITVETKIENFFQYDANSQRVSTKEKESALTDGQKVVTAFKPSVRLALQLGYRPDEEVQVEELHAPHVANTTSGVPDIMLIYCDIIEQQIAGDSWSRVLRTLKSTPDGAVPYFSKSCSVDFAQLQYIPVQQTQFESISLDLRDSNAKLMPFQSGVSSVKLHFRKSTA